MYATYHNHIWMDISERSRPPYATIYLYLDGIISMHTSHLPRMHAGSHERPVNKKINAALHWPINQMSADQSYQWSCLSGLRTHWSSMYHYFIVSSPKVHSTHWSMYHFIVSSHTRLLPLSSCNEHSSLDCSAVVSSGGGGIILTCYPNYWGLMLPQSIQGYYYSHHGVHDETQHTHVCMLGVSDLGQDRLSRILREECLCVLSNETSNECHK